MNQPMQIVIQIVPSNGNGADVQVLTPTGGMPMTTLAPAATGYTFHDLKPIYYAWGRREGGKKKRPWSDDHAKHVEFRLNWWISHLPVARFADLTLTLVEDLLAKVPGRKDAKGRAKPAKDKTRRDYGSTLLGFRQWAIDHDYYEMPAKDPLRALTLPDGEPEVPYRALTLDEYRRLLAVATPFRKEHYQALALTGLRCGELRNLRVGWLDVDGRKLVIPMHDTKGKRKAVIPLPPSLAERMAERAKGKGADDFIYSFDRSSLSHEFQRDLRRAEIPKRTAEGDAALHGMRDTASTMLQHELGYALTDAQKFLRHASPEITAKRYTTVTDPRRARMAEELDRHLHGQPAAKPGDGPGPSSAPVARVPQGDGTQPQGADDPFAPKYLEGQEVGSEEWRPQGDSNLFSRSPTIVNVYTNKDLQHPAGLDGHQIGLMAGEYLKHLLELPPDVAIAEHVASIERLKAAKQPPVPEGSA